MSRKAISIPAFILLMLIMVTATIERAVAVTWSENIVGATEDPLPQIIFDGLPTITQTNNGSIWIAWVKAVDGDNTIFYKTSSNLGGTWSQEKNLTDIPSEALGRHDMHPSIIQAKNGTIWLVWASNKPSPPPPPPPPTPDFSIDASPKNFTIPQGGSNSSTVIITSLYSFNEPVDLFVKNVPIDVTVTLNPTRVTPPPNDTVNSTLTISVETTAIPGNYTLSVTGKNGLLTHRVEISLEITQAGMFSFRGSSLSSLASTSTEFDDFDYEIFYKTSNDNGATWSSRHRLTNNTIDDLWPSIMQLNNGTIMVVRQSERAGTTDIFYNATSDGESWIYGDITTDPGFDQGPSAMQAKDGKIWVTWSSNRTGDDEIFYKTYDGIAWSSENDLTNTHPDIDISSSILQIIDGTIMIFWSSRTTSPSATADIYYKFSSDNGATWSGSIPFTTGQYEDKYEDTWSALAQTHDTKIWVVWASDRANQPDYANWDIYYQTSLAGDVNGDGVVDVYDLSLVGNAYGSRVGDTDYNPDADLDCDDCVDLRDLVIVCRNWGTT